MANNNSLWWDTAIGFIPIVGSVNDLIQGIIAAIDGDTEEALSRFAAAGVGITCDLTLGGGALRGTVRGFVAQGAAQGTKRIFVKEIGKQLAKKGVARAAINTSAKQVVERLVAGDVNGAAQAGVQTRQVAKSFKQY